MLARSFERASRRACAAAAAASFSVAAIAGDDYPSRTIRIIVPTAPAGAGDAIARKVADQLAATLRSPVVAGNRPGASGIIANEQVARASADGYTLLSGRRRRT